jgi:methyl-accepting chemotaxis protein
LISKPVQMMMGFLGQAGETGNLNFTDDEWKRARAAMVYKDEVSRSLAAFVEMLEQFIYYGECLEAVANRDLTIDVKKLSDLDTSGVALEDMLRNLNSMFVEIRNSASQVNSGAAQISYASQNLATGASEQAATIEEISATVSEVTEMAELNTKIATEALASMRETGAKMSDCTEEMARMLDAMQDISAKSNSISQVIKVIDDIAFQTNILALNAAVEAARAGQHGKGFAVVADEVRNLASKSAAAAQETAALIASSSESVAEGNDIVARVNESLKAVEVIAANNAAEIGSMHASSTKQSGAMAEINAAVTQLSSVVQSNSATAEETAASSEEMSAQSNLLNEIVNRFRIKAIEV